MSHGTTALKAEVKRPVLRWHGGKWRLAPWIISHFPPHRIYVEPFGGAASVLVRKRPAAAEIYNDLDHEVVNLFRILREERQAARLIAALKLTPFSRAEFDGSYQPSDDPIEMARRLVVRSYMGFGADSTLVSGNTGFRAQSPKSGRSPEKDWVNYPPALTMMVERLRAVVIECRPALKVMARHDSPQTLHYVDPPYLHHLRSTKQKKGAHQHGYNHELTDDQHQELLVFLKGLKGMVVVSGYDSAMYNEALAGWPILKTHAHADGARKRIECLWINPAAAAVMPKPRLL